MDYKTSGVDTAKGDELVEWLQKDKTSNDLVLDGVGGFASICKFQFPNIDKPCLVTCTDGVGTKVLLASHFESFAEVGQDLVAMCVNDLICCGARPLFFLDYYATGKLHLPHAQEFLQGVKNACKESSCSLIGGETAEMPGVYQAKDFDCAGFAIGVVDEKKIIGAAQVHDGDILIGLKSSGFHSNGFSLVRKVFAQEIADKNPEYKKLLLTPTRLYVSLLLKLCEKNLLSAAANITGAGLDNIPRALPKGATANLKKWELPAAFAEVQARTKMSDQDLFTTLNCGLGFVLIVPPANVGEVEKICLDMNFANFKLGQVEISPSGAEPNWVWSKD